MSQYKVIQDIEAEDKLVGPFSLRQFIYAGIAAFLGYLCVVSVMNGAAFLLVIFVPPMAFCMFFCWPWSPDQPTEVWALARIRFYFKPRRRVWDQSGVKELVTITAPKKIEKIYTDGLSQTEVRSRLNALADTIDSRGWAVKNSSLNLSAAPAYVGQASTSSDRLIDYGNAPQEVPDEMVLPSDDILDEQNNPIAQQFDQLISSTAKKRRSQLVDKLRNKPKPVEPAPKAARTPAQPANDYWFMNQPAGVSSKPVPVAPTDDVVFTAPQQITPGATSTVAASEPTAQDEAVLNAAHKQVDARNGSTEHLKTIDPSGAHPKATPAPAPDAITLDLARNNDLNVATLARQAKKDRHQDDGEVVISLH